MKRLTPRAAAIGIAIAFSNQANALEFEQVVPHRTILGLPLDLSVPVRLDAGESLSPPCVHAGVWFGGAALKAPNVRFDVSQASTDVRAIRIQTNVAIDEPVITVNLSAGCDKPVSRKVVVFADPPVDGFLAPFVPEKTPEAAKKTAHPLPSKRQTALAQPETFARITPLPALPPNAGSPVGSASRLKLDAMAVAVNATPALKLSGEFTAPTESNGDNRATAAALWRVMNASPEELAAQQERLAQLEVDLGRIKKESEDTTASFATLQARLAEVEQRQYSNPLVYALGAFVLLLGAGIVYLLRGRAQRQFSLDYQDSWWAPTDNVLSSTSHFPPKDDTTPMPLAAPSAGAFSIPEFEIAPEACNPLPPAAGASASSRAPQISSLLPVGWFSAFMHPDEREQETPPSALASATEDLDRLFEVHQQVEKFLEARQIDAAIETLNLYLNITPRSSPWPYLKLFELYQRQQLPSEFKSLQASFSARFQGYPCPAWNTDFNNAYGLVDYPEWIEPLVKIWSNSQRVFELLMEGLFHHQQETILDGPAYEDLLILTMLARDLTLAEQPIPDVSQGVDIELPFPLSERPLPEVNGAASPLLATAPLHVQVDAAYVLPPLPLSVDFVFDEKTSNAERLDPDPEEINKAKRAP